MISDGQCYTLHQGFVSSAQNLLDFNMFRIAFVVHTFQAGGLERCVARISSCLDRARFQPMIICLDRSGNAENWLEADDVPIFELHRRPGNDPRLVARLARLLRNERVDIVHSHNWGSLLETVFARYLSGTPFHVHAERGLELAEMQARVWRRRARDCVGRTARARADAVVAVSREIRDKIISSGVASRRVHLIPNGIDPLPVQDLIGARARIRNRLGVIKSTILVCCVGRFVPVKDFATVIQAIVVLAQAGQDVHLVLVGDGPEHDALQAQVRSTGFAERIHLVGEQADVGAWLAAVDIYVNASLYEGMSQAVLEAMAAGLPLVVTDVGENAVLAGGNSPCGRVIPTNDVNALASALGELTADRALRMHFGERARRRQRDEFSQAKMVRRYEELYSQLAIEKTSSLTRIAFWRR